MRIDLDEGAFAPVREYDADAGMDLRTPVDFLLQPHSSAVIDTGVHMAIPVGHFGKLESKSGLNVNHNIASMGGVIDSGYTGSIRVKLYNFGEEPYQFMAGDKIVQIIIIPFVSPVLLTGAKRLKTERGANGFGSTGR